MASRGFLGDFGQAHALDTGMGAGENFATKSAFSPTASKMTPQ
jgi:hypothetical protein